MNEFCKTGNKAEAAATAYSGANVS